MRISDWSSDVCSSDLSRRSCGRLLVFIDRIQTRLERLHADPAEAIEEGFFGIVTPFEIGVHDALDAVGNLVARQRTAHALSHRRAVGRRAAEPHLVPLLAPLLPATHAHVADPLRGN